MDRLIFPMKKLRVTQTYLGNTSHKPHTTGNPKDYPIDIAGADGGRDWVYCPCKEMQVIRVYGVGGKGVNTVWLTSIGTVHFADGTNDYVTIMCIHPNDDDLRKLKVGQRFTKGQPMFREGTDGATGNHIHLSVGKGGITGNGWQKNSTGKWVLTTRDGTVKPEEAMYIDRSFTEIINAKGLNFKDLPKNDNPYVEPNYIVNKRHHEYGVITKGNEGVKWLQYELQSMGLYHDKIDGFFGPKTVQATKDFQTMAKSKGIYHDVIDGSCGPLTRNAINQLNG